MHFPLARSPQGPLKTQGPVRPHQLHCPKDGPVAVIIHSFFKVALIGLYDSLESMSRLVQNTQKDIVATYFCNNVTGKKSP